MEEAIVEVLAVGMVAILEEVVVEEALGKLVCKLVVVEAVMEGGILVVVEIVVGDMVLLVVALL